jgi:radical SAM-linked protein
MKVNRSFLVKEWQAAHAEKVLPDCRWHACNECGVCDFDVIQPRLHDQCANRHMRRPLATESEPGFHKVFKLTYAKIGKAKYFAHLELVNMIIRSLRRAGIPVKYSEGFHPMPKISFDDPLPVGIESLNERFFITVPGHVDAHDLLSRLGPELPEGIELKGCILSNKKRKTNTDIEQPYFVQLNGSTFDPECLDRFSNRREYAYIRQNRKGRQKSFDLKKVVSHIELKSRNSMQMLIREENGITLRPQEILRQIFGLSLDELKTATVIKGLGGYV